MFPTSGAIVTTCLSCTIFFDTTTFTVNMTACMGPNLEKSFIFGQEAQLSPCRVS